MAKKYTKPFIHHWRVIAKALCIPLICSLAYYLGLCTTTSHSASPLHLHTLPLQTPNCSLHNPPPSTHLDFLPRHTLPLPPNTYAGLPTLGLCPGHYSHHCPCQDLKRMKHFPLKMGIRLDRHCPEKGQVLRCLIPKPTGYRDPVRWPESRDRVWFANVPFERLTVSKAVQNWVRRKREVLVFPGGGTSFKAGVKGYVEEIRRMVPLERVRTVLDIGCGVASFGARLLDYDILTMSIAPRDGHEAQVQFALERGLPAMLGVLSTYRLPFPARSFDMAHCARCLIHWASYGGLHLVEIDRILRPGGYWVLSGPPIDWKNNYKGWNRTAQDLKNEQTELEDMARRLCWKKIAERGATAVWQKPTNHRNCYRIKSKVKEPPPFCQTSDHDAGWDRKLELCITPLPNVTSVKDISGGVLERWPKRVTSVTPRVLHGSLKGITSNMFLEDNSVWTQRVLHYARVLPFLSGGRYRNVMDMNAGLGGFAAALSNYPVWVMNVIPTVVENNTLGVIYERGFIGTYVDWCEAFSTYPRTYDMIHANGILKMYMDRCDIVDILLEMYRILRPEGAVIIRDHVDVIVRAKAIADQMQWHSQISHSENGPFHTEKVLFVDNSVRQMQSESG